MRVADHAPAQGLDDGMSLIETIVALFIVAVVMTSSGVFFISGLKHAGLQTQRQTAITLANQALEAVQAVDPKKLVIGRTQAAVTNLLGTAGASALTAQDVTSTGNYDPAPTAAPVVPTTSTQTVSGVAYTLRTFIDLCYVSTTASQTCTPTAPSAGAPSVYRVTVAVTWTPKTVSCSNGCSYVVSALVDKQRDPKFNANVSAPTISAVTPASLAVGASRTITIDGTGFGAGAQVAAAGGGGSTTTPASNTGTRITVTWTAGSTPGSYSLTVTNPDGGQVTTTVTVTAPPAVTSISPSSVPTGAATAVTITGSGFQAGAQIALAGGTVSSASFVSATQLKATFTPGSATGPATVTVTNPDGGTGTGSITVTAPPPPATPPPTLTGATQGATKAVGTPTTISLTGTNFLSGMTVTANTGTVNSVTLNSSTSATVTFTPSSTNTSTTFTVTTSGGSASRAVTVTTAAGPAPTITRMIVPGQGDSTYRLNAATAIFELDGSNFTGSPEPAVAVSGAGFGTVGTSVTHTATTIRFTVTVPSGQQTNVPVTITVTVADGQQAVLKTTVSCR